MYFVKITKKRFLILLILLIILISLLSIKINPAVQNKTKRSNNINKFYQSRQFYNSLYKSRTTRKTSYKIKAGILPHHLLASDIIADYLYQLSFQKPQTLIILGPNHYESGTKPIIYSDNNWTTPNGDLLVSAKIDQLRNFSLFSNDAQLMQNDHSIAAITPYIKWFMPDVQIIPMLVSNKTPKPEIDDLARTLTSFNDQNTVYLGAFDFSHYRNAIEAQAFDQITLRAIRDYDYNRIVHFNNDHTDSPVALVVLLKTLNNIKVNHTQLLSNTNSGIMLDNPYIQTTSYISINFY